MFSTSAARLASSPGSTAKRTAVPASGGGLWWLWDLPDPPPDPMYSATDDAMDASRAPIGSPVAASTLRARTYRPSAPSIAYSKSSSTKSSWHAVVYASRGFPATGSAFTLGLFSAVASSYPRCAPVRYGRVDIHAGSAGKSTPSLRGGLSPAIRARMSSAIVGVRGGAGAGVVGAVVRRSDCILADPTSPSGSTGPPPSGRSSSAAERRWVMVRIPTDAPGVEGAASASVSLASGLVLNEKFPKGPRRVVSTLRPALSALALISRFGEGTPYPSSSSSSIVASPPLEVPKVVGNESPPIVTAADSPGARVTAASTSGSDAIFATTARYLSTSLAPVALRSSYARRNAAGSGARSVSVRWVCVVATFVTSYGEIILPSIATDAVASPSAPLPSPMRRSTTRRPTSERRRSVSSGSGGDLEVIATWPFDGLEVCAWATFRSPSVARPATPSCVVATVAAARSFEFFAPFFISAQRGYKFGTVFQLL